ncbi:hypothetical protein [Paenibacillus sp. Mc5Re-14]|nr:hypothetical protein [Paenibacillus sp. Mc5Re-14]
MTEEQRSEFVKALENRQIFNDYHKRHLVRLLWEENQELRKKLEQHGEG